jgi:hypothetical protein
MRMVEAAEQAAAAGAECASRKVTVLRKTNIVPDGIAACSQ